MLVPEVLVPIIGFQVLLSWFHDSIFLGFTDYWWTVVWWKSIGRRAPAVTVSGLQPLDDKNTRLQD